MNAKDSRCVGSNLPLLANLKAMCPDCKQMTPVRMVDGLWIFLEHEADQTALSAREGQTNG